MKNVQVTHHTNKGANQELLPNRHALNKVSKGDPGERALGNYAKATPGIGQTGPDIMGVDTARK